MSTFTKPSQLLIIVLIILLSTSQVFAADVSVPYLQLVTRGTQSEGFSTNGKIEFLFEGGIKVGGGIRLGLDGTNLSQVIPNTEIFDSAITSSDTKVVGLNFLSANLVFRDLVGPGINLEYFVGQNTSLASGDIFSDKFGSFPVTTNYRGFSAFDKAPYFNGIHKIHGTGMHLEFESPTESTLSLFAYQEARLLNSQGNSIPRKYSADIRFLANSDTAKLEIFAGGTFPQGPLGIYRGGLLLYAGGGPIGLFIQAGIPKWDPSGPLPTMSNLYILIEPRISLGTIQFIPTFFWRPSSYLLQSTNTTQAFDANVLLGLGDIHKDIFSIGIEGNLKYNESTNDQLKIKAIPFINFRTPGAIWQLKTSVEVYPTYLNTPELVIGVEAKF